MRYSAIQCDTVRYSAIQCGTVQYSAPVTPSGMHGFDLGWGLFSSPLFGSLRSPKYPFWRTDASTPCARRAKRAIRECPIHYYLVFRGIGTPNPRRAKRAIREYPLNSIWYSGGLIPPIKTLSQTQI